jgi:hypothetical protein
MGHEGLVSAGLRWARRVVVDVMSQLQRCLSPPAVGRNAKLRRFVQPPRVGVEANCSRCLPPTRIRLRFV